MPIHIQISYIAADDAGNETAAEEDAAAAADEEEVLAHSTTPHKRFLDKVISLIASTLTQHTHSLSEPGRAVDIGSFNEGINV